MNRRQVISAAGVFVAIALGIVPAAQAQWWGYGGWGGWGGRTVGGDVARGMGMFASGVGQYNEATAAARSINVDTRMRLNEYLWQSEQVRRQRYYEKTAARRESRQNAAKELEMRHLYNPQRTDIVSGDALNAILHQLRNPSVPDSLIEISSSGLKLKGEQVRLIPLKFASKGLVISAHRLAAEDTWPDSLQAPQFDALHQQYSNLIEEIRNRPDEEEIPDAKIVEAINIIEQLRDLAERDLTGREYAEAERFLKSHAGLLQMARKREIQNVLQKAYEQESIDLANALLFMDVFNLEFGAADDPDEMQLYIGTLYPMMSELRNRVANEMGGKIPDSFQVAVGDNPPLEAFEKLDWEQLGRDDPHPPVHSPDEAQQNPRRRR